MSYRISTLSFRILLTLPLAAANVAAETPDATGTKYSLGELYAELPAEIVRDGAQFKNIDDDSQLRQRINGQNQESEKSQQKHQHEEQSDDEHKRQNGSMNQMINGDDGERR